MRDRNLVSWGTRGENRRLYSTPSIAHNRMLIDLYAVGKAFSDITPEIAQEIIDLLTENLEILKAAEAEKKRPKLHEAWRSPTGTICQYVGGGLWYRFGYSQGYNNRDIAFHDGWVKVLNADGTPA